LNFVLADKTVAASYHGGDAYCYAAHLDGPPSVDQKKGVAEVLVAAAGNIQNGRMTIDCWLRHYNSPAERTERWRKEAAAPVVFAVEGLGCARALPLAFCVSVLQAHRSTERAGSTSWVLQQAWVAAGPRMPVLLVASVGHILTVEFAPEEVGVVAAVVVAVGDAVVNEERWEEEDNGAVLP
jgi:hypothetical protein